MPRPASVMARVENLCPAAVADGAVVNTLCASAQLVRDRGHCTRCAVWRPFQSGSRNIAWMLKKLFPAKFAKVKSRQDALDMSGPGLQPAPAELVQYCSDAALNTDYRGSS